MGTAGSDGFQTGLFFLAWGILVFAGLTIVIWTQLMFPSISEKNPDLFGVAFISYGLIGTALFLVLLVLNGMRKWKSATISQGIVLFPYAPGYEREMNILDPGELIIKY